MDTRSKLGGKINVGPVAGRSQWNYETHAFRASRMDALRKASHWEVKQKMSLIS